MRRPTAVTTLARKYDLDAVRKFYRDDMSPLALQILVAKALRIRLSKRKKP